MDLDNMFCPCKDCQEKKVKLQKQLDHPFYKRVDDFRDEVKREALEKAAGKYKEPFNPQSWSVRQLGGHAMSENYDQGVYIVGLMERAEELEEEVEKGRFAIIENCELRKKIELLERKLKATEIEAEYWRLRAIANAENIEKINQSKGVKFDELY
jgi:predicted ATPase with chaperone activity